MIVEDLKNSILVSAFSGKLTVQNEFEDASKDLKEIINGKKEYLKKNNLKDNDKYKSDSIDMILPKNWIWSSIGELCFVTKLAGFEYTKYMTSALSNDGEVPVVRAQNIKPNLFIDNCSEYIDINLSKQLYRCALDCKCTLMTFIGAGIGEAAIFDKEKRYHLAPNVAKIVPGKDINKFLLYYFMSPIGKNNIFKYKKQTAQPSLSMETIRCVVVPLPPLEEQQRIVNKIEELFKKLDEVKPIEEELNIIKKSLSNEFKKAMLLYAIKGNLSIQRSDEKVPCNIKSKLNPSLIPFDIPDNWIWFSHNDLFEIIGGSQPPKSKFSTNRKDGYVQLYQTRDYGEKPQPVFVKQSDVSKFSEKDDILLARYGGSIGKVFWAENGAYNVALVKVILKYPELINKKYLYYYYLSDLYQTKVRKGNRSAQAGFSKGDLDDLSFPLPPLEEQARIVKKIEQIFPLCDDIADLVNS